MPSRACPWRRRLGGKPPRPRPRGSGRPEPIPPRDPRPTGAAEAQPVREPNMAEAPRARAETPSRRPTPSNAAGPLPGGVRAGAHRAASVRPAGSGQVCARRREPRTRALDGAAPGRRRRRRPRRLFSAPAGEPATVDALPALRRHPGAAPEAAPGPGRKDARRRRREGASPGGGAGARPAPDGERRPGRGLQAAGRSPAHRRLGRGFRILVGRGRGRGAAREPAAVLKRAAPRPGGTDAGPPARARWPETKKAPSPPARRGRGGKGESRDDAERYRRLRYRR